MLTQKAQHIGIELGSKWLVLRSQHDRKHLSLSLSQNIVGSLSFLFFVITIAKSKARWIPNLCLSFCCLKPIIRKSNKIR